MYVFLLTDQTPKWSSEIGNATHKRIFQLSPLAFNYTNNHLHIYDYTLQSNIPINASKLELKIRIYFITSLLSGESYVVIL